jgi:hypothetical protein
VDLTSGSTLVNAITVQKCPARIQPKLQSPEISMLCKLSQTERNGGCFRLAERLERENRKYKAIIAVNAQI